MNRRAVDALMVTYYSPSHPRGNMFRKISLIWEIPDWTPVSRFRGSVRPSRLGGTSVTMQVYVDDVDAACKRAVDSGATSIMPPEDSFWGDRFSMVKDPFGHNWAIVTVK